MPAIITDQLRISKTKKFVDQLSDEANSYYVFVGLPNSNEYDPEWNTSPLSPRDSFIEENDYWDTMIALKKIKADDVKQCIRRVTWDSGITYDMYRHDISRDRLSLPSGATSLYTSNYYVLNSDYRVYICLYNGTDPENPSGKPSLDEPTFTDLEPRAAGDSGDGYIWKYLFSVKPSDIIKFDSVNFIPVPKNWGSDPQTQVIRNNASTSGQIKTAVILDRGSNLGRNRIYKNVPIKGDGVGAKATISTNNDSKVQSIIISNGGSGYTYGTVDFLNTPGINLDQTALLPSFDVIIPPNGGHGYDINRELGAYYAMIYSKIENDLENPDFILGNEISRIGIVENPEQYNSNSLLVDEKISALNALKLTGITNPDDFTEARFPPDSYITQTIGLGVTAVGRVISYDYNTGVLKYWQDKRLVGFNTDGTKNLSPQYGFSLNKFTPDPDINGGSLVIRSETIDLQIDTNFGTEQNPVSAVSINNNTYQLGQSFINGFSNPEVKKYSGSVIYVDHRASITRSPNQRENVKVILQF
jgi:hypothetical protein